MNCCADLSTEKIQTFLRTARLARLFPLPEDAPPSTVLAQLRLLKNEAPTHAAVLLFKINLAVGTRALSAQAPTAYLSPRFH